LMEHSRATILGLSNVVCRAIHTVSLLADNGGAVLGRFCSPKPYAVVVGWLFCRAM
jgi:hypothetical protein